MNDIVHKLTHFDGGVILLCSPKEIGKNNDRKSVNWTYVSCSECIKLKKRSDLLEGKKSNDT